MEFDAAAVFAPAEIDPSPDSNPIADDRASGSHGDPGTDPAAGAAPSAGSEEFEIPGVGKVSRDEIVKCYLRQQDYTRKTTAISQKEREFQRVHQQATAMERALIEARTLLSDRAKLAQYLASLPGGEPELPADQVLTTADVQALLKRQRTESESVIERRIRETEEKIATQAFEAQYTQTIDSHLRSLGEQHPELKQVPGMERLLREAVSSQNPASIDEALALFSQAAAFYSTRLRGVAKTVVAPPNNPLNRGLVPPSGGRTPAPDPSGDNFSGVKDPGLRDLVMKDIERALLGQRG
jgi:hypothetical protein